MKISQKCIDIIKKWEGLKLDAYLDSVGVATIGIGTIRYPDGKKVKMGDKITNAQAEEYLKFEIDKTVEELRKSLAGIILNQNQFDAVVSLCYNIGVGGFNDSTLLKKLKTGDAAGASAQFAVWNKGKVNGVLTPIAGLTNRRKDERDLFDKAGGQGQPIESVVNAESPQDKVTHLVGFREGSKNIIAAMAGKKVVELIVFKNSFTEDFALVLERYKNAKTFDIAPEGKAVPDGNRIEFGKEKSAPVKTKAVELKKGDKGGDVKALQDALVKIGCITQEEVDTGYGNFGGKTEAAVKKFQKQLGFNENGEVKAQEQNAVSNILAGLKKGSLQTELVKVLQKRLVARNYMTQTEVDSGFGTFGGKTETAVKKFQRDNLLPESGVVEAMAFKMLFKDSGLSAIDDENIFEPKDGTGYTIKPNAEVFFTKDLEKKVAAVAKKYLDKTNKEFVVTSGYRPPPFQAEAMYNKIVREGEAPVRQLYRRSGNAIVQILDAYRNNKNDKQAAIKAIKETIEKQMSRGIFISNHLLSNAVDIRKTADPNALDEATRAVGGRVVMESDHFHLELT